MSCGEAIVHCGTWVQPHDCPRNTTASLHSTSNTVGASDSSKDLPASSGVQQPDLNGFVGPASAALIASADNVSNPATETQLPHTNGSPPASYESKDLGDKSSSSQAYIYPSNKEGLTFRAPSGFPLTAASLEMHERAIPALPSNEGSVASWLASGTNEPPLGIIDWSQLVASDPLAAEIEAATVTGPHELGEESE
ncbi:hypothetical protein Q7P36_006616 [Cladosporium allicinum]